MARIKFLDVLEETTPASRRINTEHITDSSQFENNKNYTEHTRDFEFTSPRFEKRAETSAHETSWERNRDFMPRRERPIPQEDLRMSYESGYQGRRSAVSDSIKPNIGQNSLGQMLKGDDQKFLMTTALFVLFGSMIFMSGFWLGKTVTNKVKTEGISVLNEAVQDLRREELSSSYTIKDEPEYIPAPVVSQPAPERISKEKASPAPAKKKEKVASAPVVKKTVSATESSSREYFIQVSAHSTMNAARIVEDQLRNAGYNAYTSESLVGNTRFFRVRVRNFHSKDEASGVLNKIKSLGIGADGYVLTLD